MKGNSDKIKKTPLYVALFAVCLGACAGLWIIYDVPETAAIQMACLVMIGLMVTIFSFNAGAAYDRLFGSNREHPGLFFGAFMTCCAGCVILPAMPTAAWPMVIVFVLLTILSNIPTGIVASGVVLFMAAVGGGAAAYAYVFTYLFVGIAASVLVANIDEEFKTTLPVFITELFLLIGLSVTIVTSASTISIELLVYPVVNVTITLILMLFLLKLYSAKVIFRQKDNYLELNDPECMLLTKLKNISPADYQKTVHVVYFCDRVSAAIGLDTDVVKCAGLYHRIGVIGGAYNWENTRMICQESNIPEVVMDILREFEDDSVPMKRAETVVLYMCECMVSSVQYLFAKNKEMKLDYPMLAETIFKQRHEVGLFNDSDITLGQYERMKKVFMEEKLYYDFLR